MPIFVIHEHSATKLHWDLRLEFQNVLKSWAVPKIPPTRAGIKRLAIQVEDHPLSYANFEGEIKEGYGKGTVKIWDSGEYYLEEEDDKKIVFILKGNKLRGKYVLLKTSFSKNSWIFFKMKS
ncbi:MAG: DNA polymerase ligase N-terminal domain-containing protein [Candidatus Pacearchaeota archaeon]